MPWPKVKGLSSLLHRDVCNLSHPTLDSPSKGRGGIVNYSNHHHQAILAPLLASQSTDDLCAGLIVRLVEVGGGASSPPLSSASTFPWVRRTNGV